MGFPNGGIKLSTNFEINAGIPIDSRLLVANLTDRGNIDFLYEGMIVWVQSEQLHYKLLADLITWEELNGGTGSGTVSVFDNGITELSSGTFGLGGNLTQDTLIDASNNSLTVTNISDLDISNGNRRLVYNPSPNNFISGNNVNINGGSNNFVSGLDNTLTDSNWAVVFGEINSITNSGNSNINGGYNNTITDANRSVIVGGIDINITSQDTYAMGAGITTYGTASDRSFVFGYTPNNGTDKIGNGIDIRAGESIYLSFSDDSASTSGIFAQNGVVIGGYNNLIDVGAESSVILGLIDYIAKEPNTTYVDNLNVVGKRIKLDDFGQGLHTTQGTALYGLGVDIDGVVIETDLNDTNSNISILSPDDKNLNANNTTSDGDLATNSPISNTPSDGSYIMIFVNGQEYECGNAVKTRNCYFSNDGGVTPKSFSSTHPNGRVQIGDLLYWNGSIAGTELSSAWKISFMYLLNVENSGSENTSGTTILTPPSTPIILDKNIMANNTTGDNSFSGAIISNTPSNDGYVEVLVNGIQQILGDGLDTLECHFRSPDGGSGTGSLRALIDIQAGDELYWNGTVSGFDLSLTDIIDLNYSI